MKRFSLFLLLILFTLSIVDDLSKQPSSQDDRADEMEFTDINIAHIKVKPGDTVLSVTEEINDFNELDIQRILFDFEQLNPGVNIESLIPHSFYYFPLYNEP